MAERRMFSKAVIGSARFLRMPVSSRLLYYDLGMQADDDGIVEAFSVMRTNGTSEDDLKVLASKGFISVLNEDLVTYICDWKQNNLIRGDRYHPSVYKDLLVQLNGCGNWLTSGKPNDDQRETEVRLGKDRIGKDIESEADKPPHAPAPERHKHGRYGWVKLSNEEYSRLLNDLGEAEVKRCIAYIDESAQSTGNKNKWRDWNLVIRRCSKGRWGLNLQNTVQGAMKTAEDYAEDESFI